MTVGVTLGVLVIEGVTVGVTLGVLVIEGVAVGVGVGEAHAPIPETTPVL